MLRTSVNLRVVNGLAIAVLATTIAGRPIAAQSRWLPIYADAGVTVSADSTTATVTPEGFILAWLYWQYVKPRKLSGKHGSASEVKSQVLFDCNGKRMKVVEDVQYDTAGSVIESYALPGGADGAWTVVVPETRGETVLRGLCANRRVVLNELTSELIAVSAAWKKNESTRDWACLAPSPELADGCARLKRAERMPISAASVDSMSAAARWLNVRLGLTDPPVPAPCEPGTDYVSVRHVSFCY